MIKLTDGKRTVSIEMMEWQDGGWLPDISRDFFDVGGLPFDEETETYTVPDVEYCLDQANDWKYGLGDHRQDEPIDPDDLGVFVEDVN